MTKMYRFFQILLKPFYKIFFRMEVVGLENELAEGPCIICANHISMHDIFFIAVNLKRQIYFFAKKELFKNPILAKILRAFGTVSVSRGQADLQSITNSIEILKDGKYLGVFPQGTRMPGKDPDPADAKSGIGMMAFRGKSNILPVFIQTKKHKISLFRKVKVIVGKPIMFDELGFTKGTIMEYRAASRYVFEKICELNEEKDHAN